MTYFEMIAREWESSFKEMGRRSAIKNLASGNFSQHRYATLLTFLFHVVREKPQMMALAGIHFKGSQRELIKNFYKQLISEIGHEELILEDLRMLGKDASLITVMQPAHAASALIGFGFYQIQYQHPVCYAGFFLYFEFLKARFGTAFFNMFKNAGIEDKCLSFFKNHATQKISNPRVLQNLVDTLIVKKEDMEYLTYAMRVTGRLFGNLFQEAYEASDDSLNWGVSPRELPDWGLMSEEEIRAALSESN